MLVDFTLLESRSEIRKKYSYENNQLTKQSEAAIARYRATRQSLTPEKFAEFIDSLTPHQAVCLGLANQNGVTAKAGGGRFSRSKDFFRFKKGHSGAILLDVDDSNLTANEFLNILSGIHPDLQTCSKVVKYSSSAGLYHGDKQLTPLNKYHIYLFVEDLSDSKRLGKAIYTKLWNLGHGHIKVSRAGSLLDRSVVDRFVWTPERLVFEAAPKLDDGIEKRVPATRFIDGHLLKSRRITCTKAEEEQCRELIAAAKAELRPQAETVKDQYTTKEAKKLIKRGLSEEQAVETVRSRMNRALHPGEVVRTHDGRNVTIQQLKDEGNPCYIADPIEPERGAQKAKFNPATKRYPATVYSFLHGGINYSIEEKEKAPKTDWFFALPPNLAQEAVKDALIDLAPKKAIKASAGLGKTQLVIDSVGFCEKVELYVPTHKLAGDLIGRFDGATAQIIKGRDQKDDDGQPMCLRAKEAQILGDAGYSVYSNLCEKKIKGEGFDEDRIERCRWFAGCRHVNQYRTRAHVRVYTHSHLALRRSKNEWRTDEVSRVIIDESFYGKMTFKSVVSLSDIERCSAEMDVKAELVKVLMSGSVDDSHENEILRNHLQKPSAALITPSMSLGEIRAATDSKDVRLNRRVNKLIAALTAQPKEREAFTEIRKNGKGESVFCTLGRKKMKSLPDHVTCIDASLDETITRTLLGDDVKVFDVKARRNNVHVTQCTSRSFSKAQICADLEKREIKERQAEQCVELRSQVLEYVSNLSKKHSSVLLVTYKSLRDAWEGLLPPNVSVEHFGNLRGVDAYKGTEAVVVLGRNMPSPQAVEDATRSLWPSEELTEELQAVVRDQVEGEEGLQAVDRLRLIWNEQKKHVYLLSNADIDVEVHETQKWDTMRGAADCGALNRAEALGFIPLSATGLVNTGLCRSTMQAGELLSDLLKCPKVRFLTAKSPINIYILENRRLKSKQWDTFLGQQKNLKLVKLKSAARGKPTQALTWLADEELRVAVKDHGYTLDEPKVVPAKKDASAARCVRDQEIMRMRRQGLSVRAIATAIGCGRGTVERAMKKAVEEAVQVPENPQRNPTANLSKPPKTLGLLSRITPSVKDDRKMNEHVEVETEVSIGGEKVAPFTHYALSSEPTREVTIKYDPKDLNSLKPLEAFQACFERIEAVIETPTRKAFITRRAANDGLCLKEWIEGLLEGDSSIRKVKFTGGMWPSITLKAA